LAGLLPFIDSQHWQTLLSRSNNIEQMRPYVYRKTKLFGPLALSMVCIMYFLIGSINFLLRNSNNQTLVDYQLLSNKKFRLQTLESERMHLRTILHSYRAMNLNGDFKAYYIFRISDILPESINLQRVEIKDSPNQSSYLRLEGFSKSEVAIYELLKCLDRESFIKKYNLEGINRGSAFRTGKLPINFKILIHV
jgi:Tfp pilus assembly protein PilN